MLAHGTYPLASPPRGPGFRVHHIRFPSQLLSPQEAALHYLKEMPSTSAILKHSPTFNREQQQQKRPGQEETAELCPNLSLC